MANAMQLVGITELRRALEKLPKELQRTTESAALRAGATPIRKAAKGYLARVKDTGLLQKALGLTVKKTRKGQLTARVGARGGFRQVVKRKGRNKPEMANPANYAHLIEYGTSKMAARPFIRPAVESSKDQIVNAMAKGYEKGLARAVTKLRKR